MTTSVCDGRRCGLADDENLSKNTRAFSMTVFSGVVCVSVTIGKSFCGGAGSVAFILLFGVDSAEVPDSAENGGCENPFPTDGIVVTAL